MEHMREKIGRMQRRRFGRERERMVSVANDISGFNLSHRPKLEAPMAAAALVSYDLLRNSGRHVDDDWW